MSPNPEGLLARIEATPVAQAMRTDLWLYPSVEIVHIVGIVMLVGAVTMFDLRLLGFSKNLPVKPLARHLLRWSVVGLLLVVPAGLLMFSAHPADFTGNPVFLLKLGLIVAAGLNAALFHVGTYRAAEDWERGVDAPLMAKLHALISIGLWIAVISCGRLLAYT